MKDEKNKMRTYTKTPNIKPIILLLPKPAQTPNINIPLAPTPPFILAPGLMPLNASVISTKIINTNIKAQALNK